MEVYYCPQVFVCYAELRRRDRTGLGQQFVGWKCGKCFPTELVLMAWDFHNLWKLCGKCVFVNVSPGALEEARQRNGGGDNVGAV